MSRSLVLHDDLPAPASPPRLAIAAKGFRPFFLLAALFAIALVPLWLMVLAGVARPTEYLDATSWHAHEMIFGFTVAVVAGFLLTAVGNWTRRETLIGAPLLGLSALWVLGRAAMFFAGSLPRGVPALVDLAFLPLLIVALARPLVATGNRRNFVMLAILAALFAANVVVHLTGLGVLGLGAGRRAYMSGIDVMALLILIIAGRVFPMFTRNATGVSSIRSIPSLDASAIAAMAALVVLDAFAPDTRLAAVVAGVAGVLAAARAVHWGAHHSFRVPLLWVLHAGYAWLVVGLFVRAVAGFHDGIPSSLAIHALTVGAVGGITLGMMARVALGHSGRPLQAHPAMAAAFAAINAAAATRVFAPLMAPATYYPALFVSGGLWTAAFAVFLFVYTPILTSPRVDGKAG